MMRRNPYQFLLLQFMGLLLLSATSSLLAQNVAQAELIDSSEALGMNSSLATDYFQTNARAGDRYLMGLFPKTKPASVRSLSVSGFYRFFATYTQVKDAPYMLDQAGGQMTVPRSLFVGDDSQLPNLWVNMAARTSKKTSVSLDIFAFQFLDANIRDVYGTQTADSLRAPVYSPFQGQTLGGNLGINLGINLTGSYETATGSYTARMGGIHWYNLSDMTFGSNRGYNRFTLFERNPWDPIEKNVSDRYSKFYQEGGTDQDLRWGNRAFHGLILEGDQLPHNMSFSVLLGKTEQNGGIDQLADFSYGGRIRMDDKNKGFISLNTFNSRNYVDTVGIESAGFNVFSLSFKKSIAFFDVEAEFGAGRYYSPEWDSLEKGWGEMASVKIHIPKRTFKFPLELHYFRVSPDVINNNALFWNTSVPTQSVNDAPPGTLGSSGVLNPFASSILAIGQMTNNRTGINLNSSLSLGKFKFDIGYGISSEIDAVSNILTYGHPINALSRSRLWRWGFPTNVGPYNRQSVIYRDVYESLNIIPADDALFAKKHFSTLEIQGKFKTKLANKNLMLFYLGRYNTVQSTMSVIPRFSEEAYLRHYSSEFELYYALNDYLMWTNYFGLERIIANYETDLDAQSGRPRNQEGLGIGTGFDISLGKNSVLILRHRWMHSQDTSFELDKLKGQESLVELKVFF